MILKTKEKLEYKKMNLFLTTFYVLAINCNYSSVTNLSDTYFLYYSLEETNSTKLFDFNLYHINHI
jgi:hypothetical protein